MAFKTCSNEAHILTLASRVVLFNILSGIVGTVACAITLGGVATGFFLGFLIGVFNQYLCLQAARRGVSMDPEMAQGFVTRRYLMRFALTAMFMVVLVSGAMVNPWALLLGFGSSLFITTITTVAIARGGHFNPSVQRPGN